MWLLRTNQCIEPTDTSFPVKSDASPTDAIKRGKGDATLCSVLLYFKNNSRTSSPPAITDRFRGSKQMIDSLVIGELPIYKPVDFRKKGDYSFYTLQEVCREQSKNAVDFDVSSRAGWLRS
jgi:hypothetical protein